MQQIDTAANTALSVISPTSKASGPIRRVRRACSVFLDRPEITHARNSGAAIRGRILFFAVVALRETLATEVATLAGDFALDLPPELALISAVDQNEVKRRSE